MHKAALEQQQQVYIHACTYTHEPYRLAHMPWHLKHYGMAWQGTAGHGMAWHEHFLANKAT